jgi:hypothetical protein
MFKFIWKFLTDETAFIRIGRGVGVAAGGLMLSPVGQAYLSGKGLDPGLTTALGMALAGGSMTLGAGDKNKP